MASVIRYVKNTLGGANIPDVNSTGADYQLVAFDITTPTEIGLEATITVLKWTGAGTIKAILSVMFREPVSGRVIPMGELDPDTHTKVMLDETNRIITITIPEGAMYIPGNSVINLLLAIGNY